MAQISILLLLWLAICFRAGITWKLSASIKSPGRSLASFHMGESNPTKSTPKQPGLPPHLPTIGSGVEKMDVISRLLKDRILLLGSEVTQPVANQLCQKILFLASEDPKKDITLYINSPGGSVSAGLAIFDMMQVVPCDVNTVCFGLAASMGAFLLAAGTPGKRRSLPNAQIMIHQPSGGGSGEAIELECAATQILYTKAVLNTYFSVFCDQPVEKIARDTDRDFYMTASEALSYGIIDSIVTTKRTLPSPAIPSLSVSSPVFY